MSSGKLSPFYMFMGIKKDEKDMIISRKEINLSCRLLRDVCQFNGLEQQRYRVLIINDGWFFFIFQILIDSTVTCKRFGQEIKEIVIWLCDYCFKNATLLGDFYIF